jgi:serine/threonine protein kinase
MNLEIGTQLGDYRLLSRIGKGSYGIVYEAEHAITRRIDALKLMLYAGPCAADDEQRFLREIQVQAALQHPNIAAVYTAFRTEWGPALAMERVRGLSLRAILDRGRPPLAEGIRYMLAALNGLSAAEHLGIVHRDVKPENILITPEGEVKLTDFGLAHVINGARLTGSGENIGTPCYMSPEQVVATEPVDARSDVYSAGVVLYEVVTGNPPFTGTNGFAVMLAHRNTPPVPPIEKNPEISARLNRVILTALEKDPAHRFNNAREFHDALQEVVAEPQPIRVSVPRRLPRIRNYWRWVAVTAAAAAGLGGVLAIADRVAAHRSVPSVQAHTKTAPASVPAAPPPAPAPAIAIDQTAPSTPAPAPPPEQAQAQDPEPPPPQSPARSHKAAATPKRRPASPASTLPQFISTSDQPEPVVPKPSAEYATEHPAPPPPAKSFEAAPAASAPPEPASAAPTPAPSPVGPDPQAADAADAPKRRNAVVRAFGKIFHKRQNTNTTAK